MSLCGASRLSEGRPSPRLSCELLIVCRGLMRRAEQSMLDAAAEEEGQAIGSEPPHRGPDTERWPLGRHNLQLHLGSHSQLGRGSDLGAERADVQGARQVTVRSRMDENGPRNASAGVLPPVLLSRSVHESIRGNSNARSKANEHGTLGIVERLTVRFGSDAGVTYRTPNNLAVLATSAAFDWRYPRRLIGDSCRLGRPPVPGPPIGVAVKVMGQPGRDDSARRGPSVVPTRRRGTRRPRSSSPSLRRRSRP